MPKRAANACARSSERDPTATTAPPSSSRMPSPNRAAIADLNKQGGINGRKVVPVFAAIDPLGTAPAQEACIKLTEDEKVFAVMSFFNADAPLCFVDSHDTPLLGGQTTPANLSHAK